MRGRVREDKKRGCLGPDVESNGPQTNERRGTTANKQGQEACRGDEPGGGHKGN